MNSSSLVLLPGDKCYGLTDPRFDFLKSASTTLRDLDKYTIDFVNDLLREVNLVKIKLAQTPRKSPLYPLYQRKLIILDFKMEEQKESILKFDQFCRKYLEISNQFELGEETEEFYYHGTFEEEIPNLLDPYTKTRCKAGIIWTLKEDKELFFVLDELDLREVFEKTGCDLADASSSEIDSSEDERPLKKPKAVDYRARGFGNSYTACEMRFIYRLFKSDTLTDRQKKLITFVKKTASDGYVKTLAPWITDPAIVGSYKPSNINRSWKFLKGR